MHLRVQWPQSFILVFCHPWVFSSVVQSVSTCSVCRCSCLSKCVHVSWCLSAPVSVCSLFACLLFPLDGMGRVSQGKNKPTKKLTTIWKAEFVLICNSPFLTFIFPSVSICSFSFKFLRFQLFDSPPKV